MVCAPCLTATELAQPTLFPYWDGPEWAAAAELRGWPPDDTGFRYVARISILQQLRARAVELLVSGDCTLAEADEFALTSMRKGFTASSQTLDNALYSVARFVAYARNHELLHFPRLIHDSSTTSCTAPR